MDSGMGTLNDSHPSPLPGPEAEKDGAPGQDEEGSDPRLRRGVMPTTPDNLYRIFHHAQQRLPSGIFQGRSNQGGTCLVTVKYDFSPPLSWQVSLQYSPSSQAQPIVLEFELYTQEDLVTQMDIGSQRVDVYSWEVDLAENKMANQKHLSLLGQVPDPGSSIFIYDKKKSDQKKISLITCHF